MLRYLLLFVFISFSPLQAAQVVLVTGASRGIGLSIAKLLTEEGFIVYAGHRESSSKDELELIQQKYPERLHPIFLDVTDQTSIDQAVATIMRCEGRLDVLVNNAGIMSYGSIENITIEEAQAIFDVNFFGVMRVTQAVLPFMRSQNAGRIIQISSRSGFRPLPSLSVYAASKFALEGFSETMAAVLKNWNIFVSLIEPGPVNTDLDFISPYGSRLAVENDPYRPIFLEAGLLDPLSPFVQQPEEIALIVKEAICAKQPFFRYQTTNMIRQQAANRLVDVTGLSSLQEWEQVLSPAAH